MKIQHYTILISLAFAGSASCATKHGISEEVLADLRKTAHTPDYSRKVIAIDHKGETITFEPTEKKKAKTQKKAKKVKRAPKKQKGKKSTKKSFQAKAYS